MEAFPPGAPFQASHGSIGSAGGEPSNTQPRRYSVSAVQWESKILTGPSFLWGRPSWTGPLALRSPESDRRVVRFPTPVSITEGLADGLLACLNIGHSTMPANSTQVPHRLRESGNVICASHGSTAWTRAPHRLRRSENETCAVHGTRETSCAPQKARRPRRRTCAQHLSASPIRATCAGHGSTTETRAPHRFGAIDRYRAVSASTCASERTRVPLSNPGTPT